MVATSSCASSDDSGDSDAGLGGADGHVADTSHDIDSNDIVKFDAESDSTPDVPSLPDADCTASCSGKQCGSNGCGGSCGTCAPGTACSAAGLCVAPPGESPYGAFCGATEECGATVYDEELDAWIPNPLWPACIHAECTTGLCQRPVCTRSCTFFLDAVDNSGATGLPDGVEDPEFDSCGGAVDGPLGSSFRCVNYAAPDSPPVPICTAGTDFARCAKDSDCPDTETCDLIAIFGELQPRCVARASAGVAVGSECQSALASSPDELCQTPGLCELSGCTAVCQGDESCVTAGAVCSNKQCAGSPQTTCETDADCSAWACQPFEVDVPETLRGCEPKFCELNADCLDPGFRCNPRQAISTNGKPSWAHRCLVVPSQANATLGQPCANDPDSGALCEVPDLCFKGSCSELCESDSDCNEEAGQVCAVAEVPVDTDGDLKFDNSLALPLCESMAHEGELTACASDADCAVTGEYCVPIQLPNPEGSPWPYRIERTCRAVSAAFGGYGAACGTSPGSGECRVGFCTFDDLDAAFDPMCSESCGTASDCPSLDVSGAATPSFCRSIRYGQAGTFAPQDDLFTPVCWPARPQSSLADCGDDKACGPGEVCTAWPIATSPELPGSVEYLCQTAPSGGAAVGEPCEVASDCSSLLCIPDLDGGGYCGALCDPSKGDLDCIGGGPYMVCDEHIAVDRTVSNLDLVVPQCRKAQSCLPCERHADCTDGMECVRLAGNRVCSWACSADGDCGAKDGGPVCVASTNAEKPSESLLTCRPLSCGK